MDGISVNDLFQASAFSKGYNGKRAKGFFKIRLYVTDNGMYCLS